VNASQGFYEDIGKLRVLPSIQYNEGEWHSDGGEHRTIDHKSSWMIHNKLIVYHADAILFLKGKRKNGEKPIQTKAKMELPRQ